MAPTVEQPGAAHIWIAAITSARSRQRDAVSQATVLPPAGLFFITPALQNLDVGFQGLNTWHPFQYLAVAIFLNRCRQARGVIGSATVARFVARGWGMYAVGIGLTAA